MLKYIYILHYIASSNPSLSVCAGVSAAVVVIVSVVSSLITFCITYLIMRKNGQQNGGQSSHQDKVFYESVEGNNVKMDNNPAYGVVQ